MAVRLEVVGGPRKGLEFRSADRAAITIGRSKSNDFHVLDTSISRVHAVVAAGESGWYVEDCQSSHGVWVGDARVARHDLTDGTLFRLGTATIVRFSVTEDDALLAPGEVPVAPKCVRCGRPVEIAEIVRGGAGRPFHLDCRDLDHLVGDELGEFKVVAPIEALGEGFYFRAHQPALSRPVVLAVFDPPLVARPGYRDALLTEVRRASRFLHPHILQILDFGEARGMCFVVMEYFEGRPLGRVLEERRFVKIRSAAQVAVRALDAHDYAREQGALAGWLSPARLLLSSDHDVKLWLFEDPGRHDEAPPPEAAVYVAPEMASGDSAGHEETALVYSVAAVLYHMLAGIPPFEGSTPAEVARRARVGRPPALRRINLKVSPALAAAVEGALAREPTGRPASLREFRDQIARAAGVR